MPASFQQQSRLRKLIYFGLIALIFTVTVVFRKGFLESVPVGGRHYNDEGCGVAQQRLRRGRALGEAAVHSLEAAHKRLYICEQMQTGQPIEGGQHCASGKVEQPERSAHPLARSGTSNVPSTTIRS